MGSFDEAIARKRAVEQRELTAQRQLSVQCEERRKLEYETARRFYLLAGCAAILQEMYVRLRYDQQVCERLRQDHLNPTNTLNLSPDLIEVSSHSRGYGYCWRIDIPSFSPDPIESVSWTNSNNKPFKANDNDEDNIPVVEARLHWTDHYDKSSWEKAEYDAWYPGKPGLRPAYDPCSNLGVTTIMFPDGTLQVWGASLHILRLGQWRQNNQIIVDTFADAYLHPAREDHFYI